MKLTKSLLLGSAAAVVAVSAGYAADLPSKKAAPASYVKVCDAYGAGFFYIPGTDTCLHVGGRVRADYGYYKAGNLYTAGNGATTTASQAMNSEAWEARGRVDLDARTQTSEGTVQTVAILRAARDGGNYNEQATPTASSGKDVISSSSAALTLERAYIRWAGITAGANSDNFSFMPSYQYDAGHWSSFANGAKQLSYTAVLGGGLSATLAIQDYNDTAATNYAAGATTYVPYNNFPLTVGRLDFTQGAYSVSARGAYHEAKAISSITSTSARTANTWALALGVSIDLAQIAAGDKVWFDGGYATGMTEYTINWGSFKSSAEKFLTTGYQTNPTSFYDDGTTIHAVKSWNLAADYLHYWAPKWRSNFVVSGGGWMPDSTMKAFTFDGGKGIGNGTTYNVIGGLAYLPAKDFEVGVELAYNHISQDINNAGTISSKADNGFGGRVRLERGF